MTLLGKGNATNNLCTVTHPFPSVRSSPNEECCITELSPRGCSRTHPECVVSLAKLCLPLLVAGGARFFGSNTISISMQQRNC
jgi:hypothetical protein